jgi:hypothetical protein
MPALQFLEDELRSRPFKKITPAGLNPSPPENCDGDTTAVIAISDVKSMRASNLDYKIVILVFSLTPPQKPSSLITGKVTQSLRTHEN